MRVFNNSCCLLGNCNITFYIVTYNSVRFKQIMWWNILVIEFVRTYVDIRQRHLIKWNHLILWFWARLVWMKVNDNWIGLFFKGPSIVSLNLLLTEWHFIA